MPRGGKELCNTVYLCVVYDWKIDDYILDCSFPRNKNETEKRSATVQHEMWQCG